MRFDIFHFAAQNKTVHLHNARLFPPMANFSEKKPAAPPTKASR